MTEAAFMTPPARRARQQRTSLGSVASSGNRSSRRGSSLLGSGTESELTPSGTQILHAGLKRTGRPLALQVLGVYRYVADPVLRGVLPPQAAEALEWDVFDLVVSDGQMKMKAILSPALNDLVWRGLVGELDIVEIDDYELLTIHDDDDDVGGGHHATLQQPRSVCIIHELIPRAPLLTASQADDDAAENAPASQSTIPTPRTKIVYSVGSALLPSPLVHGNASGVPDLQFISEAHIRDHGALPLAGKRLYYLSLLSDDYPADWEPVQCEPLTPVSRATPWAAWNRRRRYCTDIFTSQDRKVHTIREVNVMTSHVNRKKRPASELDEDSEAQPSAMTPPPMIGIVQFKSALVHTGAPNVVNEFPFMFHIVLADRERMVAVAFFGSMAAMHFLVVQEGDVVQLQGYLVTRSAPRDDEKSKKLFVFPHKSTGVVSLVPDKYWKLLETMQVLEKRPRPTPSREHGDHDLHSTVWLEPFFWNTLHTRDVRMSAEEADTTHFDFVGVTSFVSRVHRHRPHRDGSIDANTVASLTAYRWLKVIDAHSTSELVVRLYVNSQPTAFHAIQAGDMVLLSKLKWVRPHSSGGGMAFASSSPFTTIRLNDAIEPYQIFSACSQNVAFAKELQASGGCRAQYSPLGGTTESWLEGPAVHDYEPLYSVMSMLDSVDETLTILADEDSTDVDDPRQHWIPMFTPDELGVYPFEDVAAIAESMDAMSHQYIRVHVALHDIRAAPSHRKDDVADIEFLVTDSNRQSERPPQPLRLRSNLLFREPALPSPLDELVAADAESLARLLTPSALESLNTASILRSTELPHFSPAKAPLHSPAAESDEQQITLATVKEYILKSRQGGGVGGIEVALHLYRLPQGGLDLWIDGISLEG